MFKWLSESHLYPDSCLQSSNCKHWLSGLLVFTLASSVTLQNHLTILRASSEFRRLACVHPTAMVKACFPSPWPDPLPYSKLHLNILRASSELMSLACVHPTASTEWARRAHSVLVRPACVHQGKVHKPTLSFEPAGGPHHSSMRFAYVYHVQIHNPTASIA